MRLPRPRWPELDDSQVATIVAAVGVTICIVIAALRFGLVVAILTVNAVVAMLILERTRLFRLVNEAHADADEALAGRDRHDAELADIRGYLAAVDNILRPSIEDVLDDLAWQHDPTTQPIQMPAPEGPPTAPADVVLIGKWAEDMPQPTDSDERRAQQAAWVDAELARFSFAGRER